MLKGRLSSTLARLRRSREIRTVERQVARVEAYLARRQQADMAAGEPPVMFLNVSTRIHYLSQNAAFQQLAAWSMRHHGVPAVQLVCHRGLRQCMLGTRPGAPHAQPPCAACLRTSQALYSAGGMHRLETDWSRIDQVERQLAELDLDGLRSWQYRDHRLGELCLPSLRWAMRRWSLDDDPPTRGIYRQYLSSAAAWLDELEQIFAELRPRALVVFNGIAYPEAVARSLARRMGVDAISHEVGLRKHSAYFTRRDATFREVEPAAITELSPDENQRLDRYLESRFQGEFTMADIKFWPEIRELPEWLSGRIDGNRRAVAIFPNVAFDTSQSHANTLFDDMFKWLDSAVETIRSHPDELFVLRAHPDENRAGKASAQSVAGWYEGGPARGLSNLVFIPPDQRIDSYELIRRSKLVLVYSSSIGLEASILGAPVVCAGRSRYSSVPAAYYPSDSQEYLQTVDRLIRQSQPQAPAGAQATARSFLHHELFKASLDFSDFMRSDERHPGHVVYRPFYPERIADSQELGIIRQGILDGAAFVYP